MPLQSLSRALKESFGANDDSFHWNFIKTVEKFPIVIRIQDTKNGRKRVKIRRILVVFHSFFGRFPMIARSSQLLGPGFPLYLYSASAP
jgi:hypothetical protein